jgi:hypothetical protein
VYKEGALASVTVFKAAAYAIKAYKLENTNMGYKTGTFIFYQSVSQAGIKALDKYQINSKLVWDCLQSIMQLG